jgi:hypothetical protein
MNNARVFPFSAVILASAWFVFVACAFSDAGIEFQSVLVLVYGSLLWGVLWFIRLIVAVVRHRQGLIPRKPFHRALLYWGFEPTALLLSAGLAFSGVLCTFRFYLGRPSLDAYVAEVATGRAQPHGFGTPERWVGLFRIRETELLTNGVVRIITSPDGFDDAGFTFAPASPPPVVGEDSYTHITGSWWHWHRSW